MKKILRRTLSLLLSLSLASSLAVTAAAFFLTGCLSALLLWLRGNSAWSASAFLTLREFCVTAPLTVPATVLYRAVYHRTHRDD